VIAVREGCHQTASCRHQGALINDSHSTTIDDHQSRIGPSRIRALPSLPICLEGSFYLPVGEAIALAGNAGTKNRCLVKAIAGYHGHESSYGR